MTAGKIKRAGQWTLTVSVLASLWYVFVTANSALFAKLALSPNAALIYLPAALRIIYPLVFRSAGVGGIILGSYLAFPADSTHGAFDGALLAILSGVAPVIGISLFRLLFKTRPDLGDLRPLHLLVLSLLCAASNAAILDLYLAMKGHIVHPIAQIMTIFVGDVMGAAIVLYFTSFCLTFVMSRQRL